MSTTKPHIEDAVWLKNVRDDLDSAAEAWAKPTDPGRISKMEALGAYLDIMLTELGVRGRLHACPECGEKHLSPKR